MGFPGFSDSRFGLFVRVLVRQFFGVRIPFYVWFPLVCGVSGVMWWWQTRHMDFLTPPSGRVLVELRESVAGRVGSLGLNQDAISVPVSGLPSAVDVPAVAPASPELEVLDFGELDTPPPLNAYVDQAARGAEHLVRLATALEQNGQFKRALLAWERVLDHGAPGGQQVEAAVKATKRLKATLPPWNEDAEVAIAISLQAGTGAALADELVPVLERIAADMELAAGGLIRVVPKVAKGPGGSPVGLPSPVAIWLAGPDGQEPSTAVVSFTASPGDSLRPVVMQLIQQLVLDELRVKSGWSAAARPIQGEGAADALMFRITRLGWKTLAEGLQPRAAE